MDQTTCIEGIYARVSESGLSALTPPELTVYLIANADFETNLGGAAGYLYNSAGSELILLSSAFASINCHQLSRITQNLTDSLSKHCEITDRASRQLALSRKYEDISRLMDIFQNAIQECSEDYGSRLEAFMINNSLVTPNLIIPLEISHNKQ